MTPTIQQIHLPYFSSKLFDYPDHQSYDHTSYKIVRRSHIDTHAFMYFNRNHWRIVFHAERQYFFEHADSSIGITSSSSYSNNVIRILPGTF